jgi:hypothetical protein
MPTFSGKTENNIPLSNWKQIYAECCKHALFIVEVRPYDEAREISLEQMHWIHCDAGPIAVLADFQGISRLDAQNILKRKAGREWFVVVVTADNWFRTPGNVFYECKNAFCDNLFFPNTFELVDGKKCCPKCKLPNIHLVIIKSKTELTAKQTSAWMHNMKDCLDALNCGTETLNWPDPKWRENQNEKQ